MKIVCNSSTIIAIARIGRLDILEKVAKSIVIPPAVYEEVVIKGTNRPGVIEVREAKWIKRRDVSDRELAKRLNIILDPGESEAIVLAKEINADLIILDDDKARKTAISEGLKVTGLLAFLIQAKEKGILKRVKPIMDELRRKGLFIGEDLYQDVILKAGE